VKVNLHSNINPEVAQRLAKALEALRGRYVRVGVPDSEQALGSPLSMAQVATINEFGSSDGRIPARPFLQRGLERSKKEAATMLTKAIDRLGSPAEVRAKADRILGRVGAYVAGQVKQGIADGGFAPNAPYTIKRKGSSMPLINTGLLRQSITWLVGNSK
jgi:phage gpG-like protein